MRRGPKRASAAPAPATGRRQAPRARPSRCNERLQAAPACCACCACCAHSQRSLASKGPVRGSWCDLCRTQPTGLSCHMSLCTQRAYLHQRAAAKEGGAGVEVRGRAGRWAAGASRRKPPAAAMHVAAGAPRLAQHHAAVACAPASPAAVRVCSPDKGPLAGRQNLALTSPCRRPPPRPAAACRRGQGRGRAGRPPYAA